MVYSKIETISFYSSDGQMTTTEPKNLEFWPVFC